MRTSTAYFAGVGTVIAAVAAGLGGGYLAANIAHPPVQAVSKLERRMSAEPIQVSAAPAERQAAATPEQTQQPQTQQSQPQQPPVQQQPQPLTQAVAPSANPNPARAEEKPANTVAAAQPVQAQPQPAKSAEPADERTAVPRDAFAKAREPDIKRTDVEKRRLERRQQWADKRRLKPSREQELEAVEESVREITEPRRIRVREEGETRGVFAAGPTRNETPRIRLFDQDD
jgi:hypothetical protein